MVTKVEVLKFVAPLVELGAMVIGAASRCPALGMGEAICSVLAPARSWNRHGGNTIRCKRVALVGTNNIGRDSAGANESHIRWPFYSGACLSHKLIGQDNGRRLQGFCEVSGPLRCEHAVTD